ncbi:hypothetical protein JCM10213v2_003665 [Rhodosporidiobolus nylandii]
MPPPPAGFPVAGVPPPAAPPAQLPTLHFTASGEVKQGKEKKEKKEKPKEKLPIEGTDWIRVTTNKGNVFYNNKETKESSWVVPEEIKEQVAELEKKEAAEREEKEKAEKEAREAEEAAAAAAAASGAKKRKADEVEAAEGSPASGEDEEPQPSLDLEVEGANGPSSLPEKPAAEAAEPPKKKKQKKRVVTSLEELEAGDLEEPAPAPAAQQQVGEEESEEDWQRQMAAQMAAEAAEADGAQQREEQKQEEKVEVPDVDQIEAAALYRILLSERDINPMAPFETELPKFVGDPRYHAVKATRDRRDIFDEYCKEKIREQRAAKKKAAESGKKVDPLVAFRALLASSVTSTRTHFSDFKRAHQKDARFREFGKTEGDREKEFKKFLRELGEQKRAAAEKADREFKEMLAEDAEIRQGDKWADVKKRHASDPRYVAVVSSSLREQLFTKHLSSLASGSRPAPSASSAAPSKSQPAKEDKAARAAASLKEREEKVRMEKMRQDREAQRARGNLGKEEAEREFGQLLVDAVRDHKARFEDLVPTLSRDPRFDTPSLYPNDKRRLFDQHLQKLYRTRLADVESLFAQHSPKLTSPFHDVLPSITSDPHVTRLVGSDFDQLERLYDAWLSRRTQKAREDFTQMLRENAIVEHWGRLKKMERREKTALIGEEGKRNDESDEDEGPSMQDMAEQVDLKAIHAVLKNDKRYLQFAHMPEERDRWIEEYVDNLAAPKTTVHQRD